MREVRADGSPTMVLRAVPEDAAKRDKDQKASLANMPNFNICIIKLRANTEATPENAGEVVGWASDINSAVTSAQKLAAEDHTSRYAIFDCAQVFGTVRRVEQLYARRT